MKCPFTGKPCLLPKDIHVTEIKNGNTNNLFLCKLCGDKYIEEIEESDAVTKSLKVISSDNGLTQTNHITEAKLAELPQIAPEAPPTPPPEPTQKKELLLRQVQRVKQKLQAAIDREDYESAAQLRDILVELVRQQKETE